MIILPFISFLCVIAALVTLFFLAKIDLKEFILPNALVLTLLCTGLCFHIVTKFNFGDVYSMGLGSAIGGGILLLIRFCANAIYKDDTLGLGDVKLMAASGIWLCSDYILLALILGSLIGLVHGLYIAVERELIQKKKTDLKTLPIPAGVGFTMGVFIAGIVKFFLYPEYLNGQWALL